MKRGSFRQILTLMLGLLVAMGMSLSAVQANNMTMSGEKMSASEMGHCSSCKDNPDGAKMMTCGATCVAPLNATVPESDVLLVDIPVDRPVVQPHVPAGWTTSPNLHPPKFITLI